MKQDTEQASSRRIERVARYASAFRLRIFLTLSITSLFFSSGPAAAAGNIHVGQLAIHPFVSVSGTYSDNIYSTPSTTTSYSDTIMTFTPGIKLELPFGRHRAEARYYGTFTRYNDFSNEDTDDAHVDGVAEFSGASRFGLRFSGLFDKGHEPRGSSTSGFIEEFRASTGMGTATYRFVDRARIQVDYGRTALDYVRPQSAFRNRNEDFSSVYFYYRFLPKTSAFVEADWRQVEFTDPAVPLDNSVITAFAGLSWEMTAKSQGSIKAGSLHKDFDVQTVKDVNTWAGAVDLRHALSEYFSLTLIGQRTVNEATITGIRYVVSTGLYGELSYRFFTKLEVSARGSFSKDRFSNRIPGDPVRRVDDLWTAGGGLKYMPREWLDFSVGYLLRKRESNIPVNDYTENAYTAAASVSF